MGVDRRTKKGGVPDPVYVDNPDDIGASISTSLSAVTIPVAVAETPTDMVDAYFVREVATFTLSANATLLAATFAATAGHGITTGMVVCFREGDRFYQGEVTNVSTNTITVDSPLDFAFTTACAAIRGTYNANLNGTQANPIIFRVTPVGMQAGIIWHINRIIITMTDASAMDDAMFGGLTALTNGVLVRTTGSHVNNLFNVKSNGEFALRAYDASYASKAPSGSYGFRVRSSFNGADKRGTPVRLAVDSADSLEVVIQDNLTGLVSFNIVAQGHRVYA